MRQQTKTVYTCDYCQKKYFIKHACEFHEIWCTKNPARFTQCSHGCTQLEERQKEIWRDGYNGEYNTMSKSFYCLARKCEVYPSIVEKKGLVEKYPEYFEGAIPMPLENNCEFYTYFI